MTWMQVVYFLEHHHNLLTGDSIVPTSLLSMIAIWVSYRMLKVQKWYEVQPSFTKIGRLMFTVLVSVHGARKSVD
jgi:hypothetical protein